MRVAGEVAEERPDKLKMIVFLTAVMPKDGESRLSMGARLSDEVIAAVKLERMMIEMNIQAMATVRPPSVRGALSP